jgi:hypothetical protein
MPQRNALCPCGSGRRFKQCHGQLPGAAGDDADGKVDFVIAGAQRAGTTSLDLHLREHPGVAMPRTRKELHFFDHDEHFGAEPWSFEAYHANFPPRAPGQLRGDSTPSYMYWTPAAERMARYNPALKIIVILRNPITRAYSHWNKERQRGRETLPFREALAAEAARAAATATAQDRRTSYVDRGFYSRQLRRLWRHFAADRTLILRSSELRQDAAATLNRVAIFLELPPFAPVAPKTANARHYDAPIDPPAWEHLAGIYAAEIQELERLLQWDCSDWRQMP